MRLSGVGGDQLLGRDVRTGNQALGFAAAISVIGASSSPISLRYASGLGADGARGGPRRAWRRSARPGTPRGPPRRGWNGASNGNGGGSGWRCDQGRRSPAFLARRLVSSASAPHTTATSSSPASDPLGRRGQQRLGHRAPDARVQLVARVDRPARSASRPGEVVVGPAHAVDDVEALDRRAHIAGGVASARAAATTSAAMSSGSGARSSPARCQVRWPTPIRQGESAGSTAIGQLRPASWAAASRRTPSAPPWRPRWRRSPTTAPARCRRPRRGVPARPRSTDSLVACTASGALARMRARPVEGPVHQLVGLDDLVDQPELERPLGREGLGGEQELHRRREGELARQPGRRAAAGEQPPLGLHHPEGWRWAWRCGCRSRRASPCPPATHGPSMAAMIGL